jgi:hypothetical protein
MHRIVFYLHHATPSVLSHLECMLTSPECRVGYRPRTAEYDGGCTVLRYGSTRLSRVQYGIMMPLHNLYRY